MSIQYDNNGTTLFFFDSMGRKISRNPGDGEAYDNLVLIRDAQTQARITTKNDRDDYLTKLDKAQLAEDQSRPGAVVPPLPLMTVVDDYGTTMHVPFDPPLPMFQPKNVNAAGNGRMASASLDRNAIMQDQVGQVLKMVSLLYGNAVAGQAKSPGALTGAGFQTQQGPANR